MSEVFLLVRLELEARSAQPRSEVVDLSHTTLANNILLALKSLFGDVGAGYPVDILKINRGKQEFLLSTYPEYLVKLRQVRCHIPGSTCIVYIVIMGNSSLTVHVKTSGPPAGLCSAFDFALKQSGYYIITSFDVESYK
jgi:hypothetical protein